MAKVSQEIEETKIDDKRLGRHIEHDPRSKDFAVTATLTFDEMKTLNHRHYGGILDQGQLGSCTGNAAAQARNTAPLHKTGDTALTEKDALAIYELATKIDGFPGQYPPDDTGSSGLAAAKALLQKGLITSYKHAFTVAAALTALQKDPVITGVNWYEGFDTPDDNGLVEISGQIRGGHEICVVGFEKGDTLDSSRLKILNSWGTSWGLNGHFFWTVATWRTLLSEQGDVTILVG
jgi:hypothetical protein